MRPRLEIPFHGISAAATSGREINGESGLPNESAERSFGISAENALSEPRHAGPRLFNNR